MGIAQRKAGTVVKCPKCAGEIIVPVPEGTAPPAGAGDAFDDVNFDPQAEGAADGSAGATAAAEEPAEPTPVRPPAPPAPPPPRRYGIFLSIGTLLISILVIVLLLVLMFVLGLIIGKQSVTPAPQALIGVSSSVTRL